MPSRSFMRAGSVAILALALAAPAGVAVAQEDSSITFLTPPWGVPPDQDALDAFQAESGITVEVIDAGQMETLFTSVAVASAAGEPAADVIFLTEEAPSNIVATGNVEDMNDLIEAAGTDLGEFAQVDFWQVDGATYAIPVYSQLVMMDFNAAKVAEAGFDAAPTTWAELDEMVRAMQESGADPNPIAFGSIDWSWYLMALSMGDAMFDDDLNPVFADEGSKAREAMAMLLGWFADEIISPGIIGQSQHTAFWEGTGTFHQGWQGSIGVANNPERSTQAPDVEYLLLPDEHFTWSFPAALGIGTGSQNREAAYQFIEWYTGADNQMAIFDAFGLYPSRPGVAAALNDEGRIAGYDVIVDQAQYLNELPRTALWWGPFTADVRSAVQEAATAGMDSDEVIDDLAKIWNDLKDEYS
ncbi:MAG: extracellular solute-binding protein [Chloroflexota bacterium]|nr:extracellular solute-binding protein [Chloroflexota bacterium]